LIYILPDFQTNNFNATKSTKLQ